MSEKIFSWLLRLYPAHFREAYHEEALQLFRDRLRNERGLLARLRLWCDLFTDFLVSVPHEYWRVERKVIAVSPTRNQDVVPGFFVLKTESPHRRVFLLGAAASVIMLFAVSISMRYAKDYPETSNWLDGSVQHSNLTGAERQRVIRSTLENLKKYYVYPDVAQKMADVVLAREKHGDYDNETDASGFAVLLTKDLREVSHDRHLSIGYSTATLPPDSDQPSADEMAQYRKDMEASNCTFEKVKTLPGNIGYVKFNEFPDPSICQEKVAAAMQVLNQADAAIFDLRDNGGGDPHMVSVIATYFFDRPTHLNDIYDRSTNATEQFWTRDSVPGNGLAHKPIYILTSRHTFSGAEEFCYDMKNLRRATIVGEVTGGGAHLVRPRRIDDHFIINLPFGRPINPVSKTDWEGTGVKPDVEVVSFMALETAEKLARYRLPKH
jgi:Peptidase family S41/N-terminal domain of Peptidase_S41 in eukaryotic IRBP